MDNESTKWLYKRLSGMGYNVGKDQAEFDSLMSTNNDSRKWAFERAREAGLNVGRNFEEFTSLVAPGIRAAENIGAGMRGALPDNVIDNAVSGATGQPLNTQVRHYPRASMQEAALTERQRVIDDIMRSRQEQGARPDNEADAERAHHGAPLQGARQKPEAEKPLMEADDPRWDTKVLAKNGEKMPLWMAHALVLDNKAKPEDFAVTAQERKDLKKRQEAYREQEKAFDSGVWVTLKDGSKMPAEEYDARVATDIDFMNNLDYDPRQHQESKEESVRLERERRTKGRPTGTQTVIRYPERREGESGETYRRRKADALRTGFVDRETGGAVTPDSIVTLDNPADIGRITGKVDDSGTANRPFDLPEVKVTVKAEDEIKKRLAANARRQAEKNAETGRNASADWEWNRNEGFFENIARLARNSLMGASGVQYGSAVTENSDDELHNLRAESYVLGQALKRVQAGRLDKGDHLGNLAKGFADSAGDVGIYTGGMVDYNVAMRLMAIDDKIRRGIEPDESERNLVYATLLNISAEQSVRVPHMYTAAGTIVNMVPYMMEMAANPASGLSKTMVRQFGRSAIKRFGRAAVRRNAKKFVAGKVATTVAGDLAESAVLVNTVQQARTIADAVRRFTGDPIYDMEGKLTGFDGDHDAISAFAKAEGAAVIENYTELLGNHFGVIGKFLGKGVKAAGHKIGLGRLTDNVSELISRIRASKWGEAVKKLEARTNYNGTLGEIAEEEAGIILNSLFVGDNSLSDLVNPDVQIDIALGIGLFGGFVSGVKTGGYYAGKRRARRALANAESTGQFRFGDDWSDIQESIDNAEDSDIGKTVTDLINLYAESGEQARAIVKYAHALTRNRGYNLAQAKKVAEATESGSAAEAFIADAENEAEANYESGAGVAMRYEQGEAEGAAEAVAEAVEEAADRGEELRRAMEACEDAFGAEAEYWMARMSENPWEVLDDAELTDGQRQTVLDYINARAVIDGIEDAAEDAAGRKRAQVKRTVEKRTHDTTGMIIPATMKAGDRQVYVVHGDVVMFADGKGVDERNSSRSVVVADAETGDYEFASPEQILEVSEAVDPAQELEAAYAAIEQESAGLAAAVEAAVQGGAEAPSQSQINETATGADAIAGKGDAPLQRNGHEIRPEEADENIPGKGNTNAENIPAPAESAQNPTGNAVPTDENGYVNPDAATTLIPDENGNVPTEPKQEPTALERIPRDAKGKPVFEEAESPEAGWDALVEHHKGDVAKAKVTADIMVENKRKALEKAQKLKPKGNDPDEILASQEANEAQLAQAGREYNIWKDMAGVEQRRQGAARTQQEAEARTQQEAEARQRAAETDENGLPFVKAEDGTTVFGEIREESGLPSAPIKLSEGYQDENGKGYGLRHIEAGHGEEIRNAGFSSVEEFVSYVAQNYDEDNIRVGKQRRNGNTTYLIQVTDSHDNTLFIELSRDGSYWNVNSGGIFRKGYSNKKETVAKTEPQQPNNAVSSGSSLSKDEQSGTSSIEPNGEPTVSERKVNDSALEKQESGAESLQSGEEVRPDNAGKGRIREAEVLRQEREAARREAERRKEITGGNKELARAYDECRDYPEVLEILENMDPMDIYEAAAVVLSRHRILSGSHSGRKSYRDETVFGLEEERSMFGQFASAEKGGRSIEELAEDEMKETCEEYGIPYDNEEARDALIDVLQSARTRSDITGYIRSNRIAQARDMANTLRRMEEDYARDAFIGEMHITPEEYETYLEVQQEYAEKALENFDEAEYNSYIADELAARQEKRIENDTDRRDFTDDAATEGAADGPVGELVPEEGIHSQARAGAGEADGGRSAEVRGTLRGDGVDVAGEIPGQRGVAARRGAEAPAQEPNKLTGGVSEQTPHDDERRTEPTEAQKAAGDYKSVKPISYDSQGNPIDENGNLIIEDVKSVADITDADFTEPARTIGLPALPGVVQRVLSTNGKKVIIKKNIFERNALRHDELTPEESRIILNEALYTPTLYGKNKPLTRPNNWIVINVPDGKGNNKLVVLEVNKNKDNAEIVHWHEVDNRGLEKIKRQAEREDGQLLILPSEESEEAGALSGPTLDSPNGGKVNTLSADKQEDGAESLRTDGSEAMEPARRYRKPRTMTGRSLFDWADTEERRQPAAEPSADAREAERANAAIDAYCGKVKTYVELTSDIEARLAGPEADGAEEAALRSRLEHEEEAMAEARRELEEQLEEYYARSNSREDARKIARDMSSRVRAEVTVRLNGARMLADILESDSGPQLREAPAESEGKTVKTGGGYISYNASGHLPDARAGEFAYMERQFSRSGEFDFTGGEKIYDRGDVAYMFRALEDYSIEHVFAVLVKDGRPRVIHIGMGGPTASFANLGAIRAGMDAFGADKVYLVHNHPSGNLNPSVPDRNLMKRVEEALEDSGIEAEGLIIDTTSGRYTSFDSRRRSEQADRPRDGGWAPVEVVRFDRAVRRGVPNAPAKIASSADVARFVSAQRFGMGAKVSYIVLSNDGTIVGNFHTDRESIDTEGFPLELASVATKFGGTSVIVYGNMPIGGSGALGAEVKRLSFDGVRMLDAVGVSDGETHSAADKGMLRDGGKSYMTEVSEPMTISHSREDFEAMHERAVKERGVVMPGLNGKSVRVVEVSRHDFTGTGKEALKAAEKWAKDHIVGMHKATDSRGEEFEYSISNDAVEKYVSRSATDKSENIGVHLAALKKLPEIISESIEAEVHADYKKHNGARNEQSKVNTESLIHRFYGAANINGIQYRVKTTIREYQDANRSPLAHSYEITQIELLEAPSDGVLKDSGEPLAMTTNSSISVAKLLKGVEKSYDPGKKLLEKSEKADTPTSGDGNRYRLVEDGELLDFLDAQPLKEGYRYSQWANMGILPPMTAKRNGEWREPMVFGRWEQSEEGMRKGNGKADLVQGNGRTTGDVAYNPYFHIRTFPLNDQFTSAYDRPELLVVGGYYSESEETSGYQAEGAKDSVGLMDWHSGSVNGQLSDDTKAQTMLSRYFKPTRIVPWSEVADLIMERVGDQNITFPINTVPPMLRAELAKRGAKFGDISGSVAEADIPMLNELRDRVNAGEWDAGLEKARAYMDAYESSTEAKEMRVADLSAKTGIPVRVIRTQEEADALPSRREQRAKGWWSSKDGGIVIVLPNNVNVADVENTFVHEVVGHKGLRALIGEERFDEFLDEVYNHASASIRKTVDRMTDDMVSAEADRLRVRKAQAHERAGEDSNASYYSDMAEARTEAEKRREEYRREAMEEYMSDLGGRIGSEGFEKMSQDELTLWGKVKAMVQKFLDKFLRGLKIAKSIRLSDKHLAYILYKSWKNLRERSGGGVFAEAEDAVMRSRTGWDDGMQSESAKIEDANNRFNIQLLRWESGAMESKEVIDAGNPIGIMRYFMPDERLILRQKVLSKSKKKHGLTAKDMLGIPGALAHPIFVFKSTPNTVSVLTELKSSGGQNIFIVVEVGVSKQLGHRTLEVNDILTIHGREVENVVLPIVENKSLAWVDKKKGLEWLSSAKSNSQAIAAQTLDDAAKIIKTFDNPTIEEDESFERQRFRDGKDYVEHTPVVARAMYEKRVSSSMYQITEATQDSMRGLMEFYKAVESQGENRHIADVSSYENAYLAENAMSSRSHAEMDEYERDILRPLLDIAARMAGDKDGQQALTDYMMAKHGLERNAYMRGKATADKKNGNRDFAGLCGLTGEEDWQDAEAAARKMADDYEQAHPNDIKVLWAAVNKATKASLKKVYNCGLLSKEQYEEIAGMYDYYVPLRGFDEKTSDDVYGYLTGRSGGFSSPIRKAEGRKSKADDPIATIAYMAQNSIIQGNRNLMKQRFLNYVLSHPSDLASVNRLWLAYDDTIDSWKPVFADIKEDMTPEEVEQEVRDFEERMEALANKEPDKYKRGRQAVDVPYRVTDGNISEHQILVKRNGESYVITINGNPRAAQAVNGLTNPDSGVRTWVDKGLSWAEYANRQLSQVYTTRNPDFVVSNFIRDMLYSNTMVYVKETGGYAINFNKNYATKANALSVLRLLYLYDEGKLDMHNETQRMFYEFMHWGGETGYTMVRDLDKEKKLVARLMKESRRGKLNPLSVLKLTGSALDIVNRAVENSARFAAFMTSRQSGRDVQRSIYDAKEITVNFNKKGAGSKFINAKGQTWIGKGAAFASGAGRSLFVFWNAAIQGVTNCARPFGRHPVKATVWATALLLLGYIMSALNDDGDDEKENSYYNMPKYIRRTNLMFRAGKMWVTVPLPVEYRAIYGMGELAYGAISGREEYSDGELAKEISAQMSQILPLDFMEGDGGFSAFIPSSVKPAVEVYNNKSWTGLPIYKDTPFNKNMPEWTKAYPRANKYLVDLAKMASDATGGNDYKAGAVNLNPAGLEYLLNGYFGGYSNVVNKLIKTGETMLGEREFDPASILLVNRVVKQGDERMAEKKLNADFFNYMREYEDTHRLVRQYENEAKRGSDRYRIILDALRHSRDGARHDVMQKYIKYYRRLDRAIKDPDISDEKKQEYEAMMLELKVEIVSQMKAVQNPAEAKSAEEQPVMESVAQ